MHGPGGGVFMGLALMLAVLSARQSAPPESILRDGFGQTAPPTSVLDAEEQGEGGQPVPLGTPGEAAPPQSGQEDPEGN